MKLSVSCNFDEKFLEEIKGLPVGELYGKVTEDFVGGGRESFFLPDVNKKRVESFVGKAHKQGIAFNYLLNAPCLGNTEYTRKGQKEIRKILDWVSEIGCDSVTVAHIFLLKIVKEKYPNLTVTVSSALLADSIQKLKFWEEEGADNIVIFGAGFIREFAKLKAMREAVTCDLTLIANTFCMQDCPIAVTHGNVVAHGSQRGKRKNTLPIDYPMLFCIKHRLQEPVNLIRANWIRPEDLHHYEDIGYTNFKLVERNTPTPLLARRVRAYAERRFDGNFFDLILPFNYAEEDYKENFSQIHTRKRAIKYFFHPRKINLFRFRKFMKLSEKMGLLHTSSNKKNLYLDNRKLDGFIDKFLKVSCINTDCDKCGYCKRVAKSTIEIDETYREEMLEQYNEIFRDMHNGSLWGRVTKKDITSFLLEVKERAICLVKSKSRK